MTQLEQQRWDAEMERIHKENIKLVVETQKLASEMVLNNDQSRFFKKRNRWFEFSLMLAVFAAGIAFAKLIA